MKNAELSILNGAQYKRQLLINGLMVNEKFQSFELLMKNDECLKVNTRAFHEKSGKFDFLKYFSF